jgi:dipeptidase D
MSELKTLEPASVWGYFDAITRVPRPSKHEEQIIGWLEDFARAEKLEYRKDGAGNLVIRKPASEGMGSAPTVVLQTHVDMVAEKNRDVSFDFLKDPIQAYVEGGWVRARGTTLGADDGIGMAAVLAILTDRTLEHGPIEALFTVDEETGLTGASNLEPDMLTGKYLVNLDSEEEGEITIGCAGGIDTVAEFRYEKTAVDREAEAFDLTIKGLTGGHSGDDIEKGYANANKLLARFLLTATEERGLRLSFFDGGNLRNAIPREAFALFTVPNGQAAALKKDFERFAREVREEFLHTEPKMSLSLNGAEAAHVIDHPTQIRLLQALAGLPNGVLAMSRTMPGLVETSSNLASVKFTDGERIVVTTSQRSSVESAKHAARQSVASVFRLAGAQVSHSDGYPGWAPDPGSHLLKTAEAVYRGLFGADARVKAIHAGLECGLFLRKFPRLEMISIGPTLRGVHSPDERLEIATVDKFWRHLVAILQNI